MDFATALFLPYTTPSTSGRRRSSSCLDYVETERPSPSPQQQHQPSPLTVTTSNGCNIHIDGISTTSSIYQLSYSDMIEICYQKHQKYLYDSVLNKIRIHDHVHPTPPPPSSSSTSSHLQSQPQKVKATTIEASTKTTSPACTIIDIVVAFLVSNNNIDYLISILAAIAATGCRSSSSNFQNHNVIQSTKYKFLPVLIPTRWTVSEMVHVLQIPPTSTSNKYTTETTRESTMPKTHVTILLHDIHYASIAHQVQEQLKLHPHCSSSTSSSLSDSATTETRGSVIHIVQCQTLPNYAHEYIMNHSKRGQEEQYQRDHNASNINMSTLNSTNPHHYDDHDTYYEDRIPYQDVSDETAIIVFTSGTGSGIAKGVCISHRAMYVQCQMKQSACSWSPTTKLLFGTTIPIYHIGGIINYSATWYCGGTFIMPLVICPSPSATVSQPRQQQQILAQLSFDPHVVFQSLSSPKHVNTLVVVPTMLHAMHIYYEKQLQEQSFSHVKCILIGGQSANRIVLNFVRQAFPKAQIIQTYACTEATSSLTYHDITKDTTAVTLTAETFTPATVPTTTISTNSMMISDDINEKSNHGIQKIGNCVGQSPSQQIIELFLWKDHKTDNTKDDVVHVGHNEGPPVCITAPFTPGIIVSRGPHVMNGYWTLRGRRHQSHNSSLGMPTNEYLITNDMGYWSKNQEQLFYIGRRSTDTIRTGGETVWCTEVEQVLQQHKHIQECTVFGVPDQYYYGEVVCCAVVAVHDAAMTIEKIRSFCAEKGLAGYKRPRHLLLYARMDETIQQPQPPRDISTLLLPRNANGKVLKYKLQQKLNELIILQRSQNRTTTATTTSVVYVNRTNYNNNSTQLQSKL